MFRFFCKLLLVMFSGLATAKGQNKKKKIKGERAFIMSNFSSLAHSNKKTKPKEHLEKPPLIK